MSISELLPPQLAFAALPKPRMHTLLSLLLLSPWQVPFGSVVPSTYLEDRLTQQI